MEARIRRHYQNIASGKLKPAPSKTTAPVSSSNSFESATLSPFSFPTPYPAHLSVHTFLVVASFFFLPRSFVLEPHLEQLRNLDRPQHPFLVPLTTRPEITVLWAALGNALLVSWWSGSIREWVRAGKMGIGISERMRDENKPTDIWNAALFTLYAAFAYSFVIVLFGAPVSTHLVQTLLLGLNLSILTVLIPAFALGVPSFPLALPFIFRTHSSNSALIVNNTWVRLFAEHKPRTPSERAMLYPATGSLLGAWAGVIPIALDWDRPWQAYPLTPLFGATIGYVLGSFFALAASTVYYLAAHSMQDAASRDAVAKEADIEKKGKKVKKA